jgi:formylglycine-generating enzyme required for sulfatase activity
VEQVRWRDAKLYCNERSLLEGLTPCYDETKEGWPCNYEANGYRLPSEAEWEFAARAGSKDRYPFGERALNQSAWFGDNAGKQTHVVGTRRPNDWGIHDMYGNVSEWCQDAYQKDYYAQSPRDNPRGPADTLENNKRVMRGGSWKSTAEMCRVTFRQGQQTGDSDACFFTDFCGFRCVRSITQDEAEKLVVTP